MANISKLNINNFDYDIKDTSAREDINTLKNDIDNINDDIAAVQSNFQSSIENIGDAIKAKGSIPESTALTDIINAIDSIKTGTSGTLKIVMIMYFGLDGNPSGTWKYASRTTTITVNFKDGAVTSSSTSGVSDAWITTTSQSTGCRAKIYSVGIQSISFTKA